MEWKLIIETKYYGKINLHSFPAHVNLVEMHTYSLCHNVLNHCCLINSNASSSDIAILTYGVDLI